MEELASSSEEEKRTEKIEVDDIETNVAAENFSKLLEEKKTYFLNGAWGSGKTDFIKNVEANSNKKFVYLDLWNIKDERTVINIAFNKFLNLNPLFTNSAIICAVTISILMTDFIDFGLRESLSDWNVFCCFLFLPVPAVILSSSSFLSDFFVTASNIGVVFLFSIFGIISLIVAVTHFLKIKSDNFYRYLLAEYKRLYKDKVLVIDDFDRVSEEKQEEAYKLFNILNGELTIVFLGDYTKIAKNEDNYLQKIIDRRIELPYDLHPKKIWGEYFKKLEKELNFVMNSDLQNLFIHDKRNIREQHHFNDYVNLEFIEKGKSGHVQTNQQLLVIYLYLFNHDFYQKLLNEWPNEPTEKFSRELYVEGMTQKTEKADERLKGFDRFVDDLLSIEDYPKSFMLNREAYFIRENASNLSLQEAEKILASDEELKEALVNQGGYQDDFYYFLVEKYKKWWPYKNQGEIMLADLRAKHVGQTSPLDEKNSEIERVEKIAFQILSENKQSSLIEWLVKEVSNRENLTVKVIDKKTGEENVQERTKMIVKFFDENYLNDFHFDLSQKLFFYSYEFTGFLMHQDLYSFFQEEIELALNDNKVYESQSRKAYLLISATLKDNRLRVATVDWNDEIEAKVSDLDGADLLEFWTLMGIFKVDYKHKASREISDIDKIIIWEGLYEHQCSGRSEYQNHKDLLDFILFEKKLEKLSKEFGFKIERARVNEPNFLN